MFTSLLPTKPGRSRDARRLRTLMGAGERVVSPTDAGMKAAADYSKSERGRTMIVLFDGKTVFERYDNGGSADKLQMLASGSKSFVGVAAVAAVQDLLFKLDDFVSEGLPEWQDDSPKKAITYRELLNLTSGLTPGERGNAVRAPGWKEIAAKPLAGIPGQQFGYGSYQLNAFAYVLERKLGAEKFEEYLKRRIFDPLGLKVEWLYRCDDGRPQVAGGAFMTARDWAAFGDCIRQNGICKDKSVLDGNLLAECFQGTAANPAYGLAWWLKKPVADDIVRKIPTLSCEWAEVANSDWLPDDLVAACGAGKQRLYLIPSRKVVIVRQGGLGEGYSDIEFLSFLLRGHGSASMAPAN